MTLLSSWLSFSSLYIICKLYYIYLILTLPERLMPRVTGLLTADTWPGNINLDLRQIKWIKWSNTSTLWWPPQPAGKTENKRSFFLTLQDCLKSLSVCILIPAGDIWLSVIMLLAKQEGCQTSSGCWLIFSKLDESVSINEVFWNIMSWSDPMDILHFTCCHIEMIFEV